MIKKRNYTQDFIRALAIFLVILLHISAYFMGDNWPAANANFWSGTFFDAFTRVCVPLFVMSSGFFLIKEKAETAEEFFKKRTNKLLTPLIFWSLLYSEYSYHAHASFKDLTWSFLSGRPYYHFWFLFMLIGLYMVTPFINTLYRHYKLRKMNILGFALLALGLIVNMWNIHFGNPSFFALWFIPYLGYFILGHTLPKMKYKFSISAGFVVYAVTGALLVGAGYWTLSTLGTSEYAFDYLSPLVILGSLSLYASLVKLDMEKSWLTGIAKYTLGIYLIHVLFMEKFFQLTNKVISGNGVLDILTLTFATFLASWAVVFIISKIPLLKKVI